jgi:rSAM/selenodomain-associated transferase 2
LLLSIIIPALNEEMALPGCLASVFSQHGNYEVIVVDGGSTDSTHAVVEKYNSVKFLKSKPGRARQMNTGAAAARGDWLLFLHADAQLPPAAIQHIMSLPDTIHAGGFRHRFTGKAWGLRLVSWLHNLRCRCTKVFYGDQAIFIRRTLFTALGGYPDEPQIEDLLFTEQLRNHTALILLNQYVLSDSRKFEQQGIWLSLWQVILIQLRHELGLPVKKYRFFNNVR